MQNLTDIRDVTNEFRTAGMTSWVAISVRKPFTILKLTTHLTADLATRLLCENDRTLPSQRHIAALNALSERGLTDEFATK